MAVRKNNPAASKPKAESAAQSRKVAGKASNDLEKALAGFHPEVVKFFSEKLRINLSKLDVATLYDLQTGRLTKPLELVVTPLVYDRASKDSVAMPPIKVVASIKAQLPYEDGKCVAPDGDKKKIFIATVPCRPYILKADGSEVEIGEAAPEGPERENPTFSEAQVMALEGIGIDRSRLYAGFNALSKDEKCDIAEGLEFPVDGAVKTDFGLVNVIGIARLEGTAEQPLVSFEPQYPEARTSEKVIDILAARVNGTLQLDFFRHGADGTVIRNPQGQPILNEAGANIVRYGMAMAPVKGYTHRREYDSKAGKYVDKVTEVAWYQVTAVNGNLFATRMRQEKSVGNDGKEILTPVVAQVRIDEQSGRVMVDGKANAPLEFASERDRRDFLEGRGGVVRGAIYHDFKTGRDVEYDAFVVPDNTRAGFAHQFTPETSKALIERREKRQSARVVKKQNFGLGI